MAAIPRSTFVMALVACVPFGLAIRETLKTPAPRDEVLHAYDDDREPARDDQEPAREPTAKDRVSVLHELLGSSPGALGSAFEGIRFDMHENEVRDEIYARLEDLEERSGFHVALGLDPELVRIWIEPRYRTTESERPEACATLDATLRSLWGEPARFDYQNKSLSWFDRTTGTRAYMPLPCSLHFEPAVALDAWIGTSTSAVVPLWAIGKPARELVDLRGLELEPTDREGVSDVFFEGAGLAAGEGPTTNWAIVERGTLVAVRAQAMTDEGTVTELASWLTQRFGKPAGTLQEGLTWSSKPAVRLDFEPAFGLTLWLGTPP